jgi:hypothetical protein
VSTIPVLYRLRIWVSWKQMTNQGQSNSARDKWLELSRCCTVMTDTNNWIMNSWTAHSPFTEHIIHAQLVNIHYNIQSVHCKLVSTGVYDSKASLLTSGSSQTNNNRNVFFWMSDNYGFPDKDVWLMGLTLLWSRRTSPLLSIVCPAIQCNSATVGLKENSRASPMKNIGKINDSINRHLLDTF